QTRSDGSVTPARSPRNANYVIDARLDPSRRSITASEVITWRNITNRAVDDLQFHVYWNAWRDPRSTWLREATLGGNRYDRRLDIEQLAVRQPASPQTSDLTSQVSFIAPDDGNRDDRTVLKVPLPQPVAPGGSIRIDIKWTAHVPRTFARTGAIGNFFFIAQW